MPSCIVLPSCYSHCSIEPFSWPKGKAGTHFQPDCCDWEAGICLWWLVVWIEFTWYVITWFPASCHGCTHWNKPSLCSRGFSVNPLTGMIQYLTILLFYQILNRNFWDPHPSARTIFPCCLVLLTAACLTVFPSHCLLGVCVCGLSSSYLLLFWLFFLYLWSCLSSLRGLSASAGGKSRCSSRSPRASGRFSAELPPGSATYLPTGRDRRDPSAVSVLAERVWDPSSACPPRQGRPDRSYSRGVTGFSMIILRSRQLQASHFLAPYGPSRPMYSSCTHHERSPTVHDDSLYGYIATPAVCKLRDFADLNADQTLSECINNVFIIRSQRHLFTCFYFDRKFHANSGMKSSSQQW